MLALCALITVALVLTAKACSETTATDAQLEAIRFSDRVHTAVPGGNLADLTPWEWDQVYLFPEGMRLDDVARRIGLAPERRLLCCDRFSGTHLIFVSAGKIVREIDIADSALVVDSDHLFDPYEYPGTLTERSQGVGLSDERRVTRSPAPIPGR